MDKCNCSFFWKEVSKFSSCCSKHNKVFSIGEKCPMFEKSPSLPMEKANSKKTSLSTFTSDSQAITSDSQGVQVPKRKYVKKVKDSIYERFHSYGVKFNAEVQWEHLFKYEPIKLRNNVEYKKIEFEKGFIKVFKKSIVVILRSRSEIVGLCAREAEFKSKVMVNEILDQLPQAIKVSDREVVSIHNAFVNHPFAVKEVSVSVDGEKRFISDNSKGYSEFEAINPSYAVNDSECIEQDIVSLIDRGLSRDVLAQSIKSLIDDRKYYAENLKSHVEAIQTLSQSVKELKEQILNNAVPSKREEVSVVSPNVDSQIPLPITIQKSDSVEQIELKKSLNRKDRIKRFIDEFR